MNIRSTIWLALLLSLAAADVRAQVPEFPDSLIRQSFTARSERYGATHATSIVADYRFRNLVNGLVRGSILSSTTLLQAASTKDQIDALVDVEYPLGGGVKPFLLADGTLTNDANDASVSIPGLNNTATAFTGAGARLSDDLGTDYIGLAVGGAYNRQLNVDNNGLAFHAETAFESDLEGYIVQLQGVGRWYDMAPLNNVNGFLDFRVQRFFDEGAYGDIEARYELASTDLYIRRSEDAILQYGGLTYDGLQARREGRLLVYSVLGYPVSDDLHIDLSATVTSRGIALQEESEGLPPLPREPDPFRYDRNELSIGTVISSRWTPGKTVLQTRLEYSTNEQTNLVEPTAPVSDIELKQKRETSTVNDFVAQHLLFGGSIEQRIGRTDTFALDGSVAIYRYDTPSENYFDRDEQSIQGQLRYARSFSPFLGFELVGQAYLTHLVYLSGRNSNDNNWNRIFRLVPTVRYMLDSSFRNDLEAQLVANYTEYDFEGRTQTVRGRSFRELQLRDSLAVAITSTLVFSTVGDLRVAERSSFSWTQFAESPLERTRTEGLQMELSTSRVEGVVFGVGGQLARVKSYRAGRSGDLEPFSDRTSVGPTARVAVHLSEYASVEFTGWWEHRFVESRLESKVPSMLLTVGMKL